jgi:V-type H+-transporting ATPase 16kDa proteolipid subunit
MYSGINSPDLVWRNLIPIVMAGVNGIYGLITAIVVLSAITSPSDDGVGRYSLHAGFAHLAAGFCCGLCGLGSGACIGIAGDAAIMGSGVYNVESKKSSFNSSGWKLGSSAKKTTKKSGGGENLFVAMVLVQVFAGNIALYGLITSIILSQQTYLCED